jgi:hypothetical protein
VGRAIQPQEDPGSPQDILSMQQQLAIVDEILLEYVGKNQLISKVKSLMIGHRHGHRF